MINRTDFRCFRKSKDISAFLGTVLTDKYHNLFTIDGSYIDKDRNGNKHLMVTFKEGVGPVSTEHAFNILSFFEDGIKFENLLPFGRLKTGKDFIRFNNQSYTSFKDEIELTPLLGSKILDIHGKEFTIESITTSFWHDWYESITSFLVNISNKEQNETLLVSFTQLFLYYRLIDPNKPKRFFELKPIGKLLEENLEHLENINNELTIPIENKKIKKLRDKIDILRTFYIEKRIVELAADKKYNADLSDMGAYTLKCVMDIIDKMLEEK